MMTPIPAVVTVDASDTVEEALRRCVDTGHTRLLVVEDENPDRVRGIVHVNSLARLLLSEGPRRLARAAIREAPIIPGDEAARRPARRAAAPALRRWPSWSTSTAASAGIVTVEDIIEEVVGEIEDETDPAGGAIRRLANGDWFVRGHVAVTDLSDYGLELPVDTDAYNSIGGYVFDELGPAAAPRRHRGGQRLLDSRRVGAREPHRGGAHPRAPRGRLTGLDERTTGRKFRRRATFLSAQPLLEARAGHRRLMEERWWMVSPPPLRRPARGGAGRSSLWEEVRL